MGRRRESVGGFFFFPGGVERWHGFDARSNPCVRGELKKPGIRMGYKAREYWFGLKSGAITARTRIISTAFMADF